MKNSPKLVGSHLLLRQTQFAVHAAADAFALLEHGWLGSFPSG
ncbi:hypothetical protein [Streptomyces sp. NPDC056682]